MTDALGTSSKVQLELQEGYRFYADFGDGQQGFVLDEPEPLGAGSGPNASAVLGAAVGNCLSASLLFCLRKARVEIIGLRTEVEVISSRNDRGRLRVSRVEVKVHPQVAPGNEGRVARCLELFEDFCVVSAAVRGGIDVDVAVDMP